MPRKIVKKPATKRTMGQRANLNEERGNKVVKTKPAKAERIGERRSMFPLMLVPLGQWIDVRSETRPEVVHHVYTGDLVNTPHCSCESFRWADIEENVLLTCKHIELVVFGKGAA